MLDEQRVAAEDDLRRIEILAPQSGRVHQLAVHTVGGVINNGETIMQIVPRADELVVLRGEIGRFRVYQAACCRCRSGTRRIDRDLSDTRCEAYNRQRSTPSGLFSR